MSTEIAKTRQPGFMELIQQALEMPATDGLNKVEIIERLYALKERDDVQRRKELFQDAHRRCEDKMPRIAKNGMVKLSNNGGYTYAKLEDVDTAIRKIYLEEGFTVSYDAPRIGDNFGLIRNVATFTCHGHSENREFTVPPDTGPGRSPVQAVKSSVTAARRHLVEIFFNLIEEGADEAGRGDMTPISQEQADDIRTRMNDLPQSQPGVLLAKLCTKYRVGQVELLRATQLESVLSDVASTEKLRRK